MTENKTKPDPSLTILELLARPPKEWLIDQVVGVKDIIMIYGDSGVGKTFFLIDLIISALMGTQFANKFMVNRKMKVVFCASEGHDMMKERFYSAFKRYNLDPNDVVNSFKYYEIVPQLNKLDSIQIFIDWLKDFQPDLIIIDTFGDSILGEEENSNTDMRVALTNTRYFANELNASICLCHHTNKSGGARGAVTLKNMVNLQVEIRLKDVAKQISEVGTLKGKVKNGKRWSNLVFTLKDTWDNELLPSCYVDWLESYSDNKRNLGLKERIKIFLFENIGRKITSNEIAKGLDIDDQSSKNNLYGLLQEMSDNSEINKHGSRKNYTYSCKS